jgi:hypothetical protein
LRLRRLVSRFPPNDPPFHPEDIEVKYKNPRFPEILNSGDIIVKRTARSTIWAAFRIFWKISYNTQYRWFKTGSRMEDFL